MKNGRLKKSDLSISKEREIFFSEADSILVLKVHASFAECSSDVRKGWDL
jgi:hypothetical protein